MIRSLATAAVLAALVAAGAAYAVSQQATWNAIEAWIGWPKRTAPSGARNRKLADLQHDGSHGIRDRLGRARPRFCRGQEGIGG
jgi:hypothetical protein